MLGTVGVSVSMNKPPRFRFRLAATSSSPTARQCTQTPPSDSTREWILLEGEVCRCPGSYRPGWPSRCGLSVANSFLSPGLALVWLSRTSGRNGNRSPRSHTDGRKRWLKRAKECPSFLIYRFCVTLTARRVRATPRETNFHVAIVDTEVYYLATVVPYFRGWNWVNCRALSFPRPIVRNDSRP
jgi:hypothetical protein